MTLAQVEEGLRKEHERRARVAAEKKREKEALETDNWGFIASRRSKRHWSYVRRYGRA